MTLVTIPSFSLRPTPAFGNSIKMALYALGSLLVLTVLGDLSWFYSDRIRSKRTSLRLPGHDFRDWQKSSFSSQCKPLMNSLLRTSGIWLPLCLRPSLCPSTDPPSISATPVVLFSFSWSCPFSLSLCSERDAFLLDPLFSRVLE